MTTDFYLLRGQLTHTCCTVENPRGGRQEDSLDPAMQGISIPLRVMKGGSHLCAPNY